MSWENSVPAIATALAHDK